MNIQEIATKVASITELEAIIESIELAEKALKLGILDINEKTGEVKLK